MLSDWLEIPPGSAVGGYYHARRKVVRIVKLYRKQAGTWEQRVRIVTEGGATYETKMGHLDFLGEPLPMPEGEKFR